MEEDFANHGRRILFRNNTNKRQRITMIRFYECENVNIPCAPVDPRIILGPGQSHLYMTVTARLASYGWSFRYEFSTEPVE